MKDQDDERTIEQMTEELMKAFRKHKDDPDEIARIIIEFLGPDEAREYFDLFSKLRAKGKSLEETLKVLTLEAHSTIK